MLSLGALDKLELAGEIKLWRPTEGPLTRSLWIGKSASEQIAQFMSTAPSARAAALADDLDTFATGGLISFGEKGYLKLVGPEAWSIRSVYQPQFRLLGAFVRPDHLVILFATSRKDIDKKWAAAKQSVTDEWDRIFPGQPRHSGVVLGDYVTENTEPDATAKI